MLQKLLRGVFLRCPNCGQGHISSGFFQMRERCEVCGVRYERKSGESAGASILWISLLPILALVLFFVLYAINDDFSLWVLLGLPLLFVVVVGVLGYRHARGVWIAITDLTEGLQPDDSDSIEGRG